MMVAINATNSPMGNAHQIRLLALFVNVKIYASGSGNIRSLKRETIREPLPHSKTIIPKNIIISVYIIPYFMPSLTRFLLPILSVVLNKKIFFVKLFFVFHLNVTLMVGLCVIIIIKGNFIM